MKYPRASLELLFSFGASFALLLIAPPLTAAEEPQYLEPTDIEDLNIRDASGFGSSLDTQGELMVVAAPNANAVYVYAYRNGSWQDAAKLTAGPGTGFGDDVSLDGNLIAVSAPAETVDGIPGAGAIYLYERGDDATEWTQVARLVASNPTTGANLGRNLVVDGLRVAARAEGANGRVHLFARDPESGAWREAVQFPGTPIGGRERDTLDLSGDTLAYILDTDVYIYERVDAGWLLKQRLEAPSSFNTIALEGDVLVIGAPHGSFNEPPRDEGVALVYERGIAEWELAVTVHGHDPFPTHAFGYAMDMRDGLLVVGQRPENGLLTLFGKDERGEWIRIAESGATSLRDDRYELAISARTLAVGLSMHALVVARDIAVLTAGAFDEEGAGVDDPDNVDPDSVDAGDSGIVASDGNDDALVDDDDALGDPDAIEDNSDAGNIIDATDAEGMDVDGIEDNSDAGSIVDTTGDNDANDFGDDGVTGAAGGEDSGSEVASVASLDANESLDDDGGGGSLGWLAGLLVIPALLRRGRIQAKGERMVDEVM